MLTNARNWTLRFDGTGFKLEASVEPQRPSTKRRVIEENLETILFHWANELLPAPRLQMLGCSEAIVREQDLLAVDGLGRIHIFELKKDTADAQSMFQLVSYLVGRPRDDEHWVRKDIARTLWYGEQADACRLAGLVARHSAEKLRTDKSRRVAGLVPHVERLDARLDKLTQLASRRTGLNLTPGTFRSIARSLLEQGFGGQWNGPVEEPAQVLHRVVETRLSPHWQLGTTKAGIIIWTIAPNIQGALKAAEPLIERYLEVRCVSVDVREVVPGIEWSIAVAVPEDHAENWAMADMFARLLVEIVDRHLEECPRASSRLYRGLQPASISWVTGKGWAELGWRAAGGSSVIFGVRNDHVELDLFNHGWTDGQAVAMREPILRLCKRLRKVHASSLPWSPQDPEAACNLEFVESAVHLVNGYWQGLQEVGAFEVDRWAYWMPPD